MLSFLKPYTRAVIISLALMSVELIVELWHPLLMRMIINEGITTGDLGAVLYWGGIMISATLIAFAAGISNSYFSSYVSQHFGYDVRTKLFLRIQTFSVAAFNKFPPSALITRMTSDVNQLQNVVFMGLRIMPRAPLMMLGALIMALLINVRIAAVLLVTVPICLFILVWMMKKGFMLFRAVQNQLDTTNSIVRENLIGMRLIKAFVRYRKEISRFAENNKQLMDRTVSALRLIEMTIPLLLLLMNVSIIVILWFGNWQLDSLGVEAGDVVAIVIYATRITAMFGLLSHILMSLARARASATRIREVLDLEDAGDSSLGSDAIDEWTVNARPDKIKFLAGHIVNNQAEESKAAESGKEGSFTSEANTEVSNQASSNQASSNQGISTTTVSSATAPGITDTASNETNSHTADINPLGANAKVVNVADANAMSANKARSENVGAVSFESVSFRYPGTTEPVLTDISFDVKPGQTVAVMGATGSGKSTLFHLLPRLYEPDEGTIRIDGIDIRSIPIEELRSSIGMVPQEVVLFTGTVTDNIRWGRNEATMDEIMEAAKHAQIHETILGLSDQYETIIGQKGVNLSGGQKQRLSIARALIRQPKLLLLDDSTSALDLKTESRLMQALRHYDCTTLIITQKVSTAIHADSVILLDQGRVLAQGSHEELSETSDLYRRIIISQFGEKAVNS